MAESPKQVAEIVQDEVAQLAKAGLKATQGDIRCIVHGHLTRLAIGSLRKDWELSADDDGKMDAVRKWLTDFGGLVHHGVNS